MSIEPINSVMTLQAQTMTITPKPTAQEVAAAEKQSLEMQNQSVAPDLAPTQTVMSTEETAQEGSEDGQNSPQQEAVATNERLKEAVARFNKSSGANSEAVFGIHEGTNRVTIKIVDKSTKAVIKELPPEKTLDMIAKVWEMAGIMVDEKR